MNDPDRLTREEIISRLRAASQKSKLKPPAPTAAQRAEARFKPEARPTVAIANAVTSESNALSERIREERRQNLIFSPDEIDRRQAALDRAIRAARGVQREWTTVRSCTIGKGDSDYSLHLSPEEQIWK
jgi:hypothetical protein